MTDLDKMIDAYTECALWSSLNWDDMVDDNPEPMDKDHDADDLADETVATFAADCERFAEQFANVIDGIDPAQVGHDLWLSRNGHGAGFFDRYELPETYRALQSEVGWRTAYPEVDLYVGDDGKIYAQ